MGVDAIATSSSSDPASWLPSKPVWALYWPRLIAPTNSIEISSKSRIRVDLRPLVRSLLSMRSREGFTTAA